MRKTIPWFYALKQYYVGTCVLLRFWIMRCTCACLESCRLLIFQFSLPLLQNYNENCVNLCIMNKKFRSIMEAEALVADIQNDWYCRIPFSFQQSFWESYSCRKVATYKKKSIVSHTNTHLWLRFWPLPLMQPNLRWND